MTGANEYWAILLPAGKLLRGEDHLGAVNRELAELVSRGWQVHSFSRPNLIGPATFLLEKPL